MLKSCPALCSYFDYMVRVLGIAALYFLLGRLGLLTALPPGFATVIWPPSGLALVAVLLCGRRIFPGIFLGSFALNLGVADAHLWESYPNWHEIVIPAEIAAGSTLQALLTGEVIIRLYKRSETNSSVVISLAAWKQIFFIALVIVPICCVVAATIGVAALFDGGMVSQENMMMHWLTWWAGDVLGVIICAPALLLIPLLTKKVFWKENSVTGLPVFYVYTLIIPIGITLYAYVASSYFLYNKSAIAFNSLGEENFRALTSRLDSYEYALKAGAGFFGGSEDITREEWRNFVDVLNVEENFPGVNGFGWINRVAQEDTQDFIKKIHRVSPNFTVHPEISPEQKDRYVITYIEPIELNGPAVGLDIAFEKNRRVAADLARDTGSVVLTKKIILVQDSEKSAGFLLLAPLYKKGEHVDTIDMRRKNLAGWIYAPFIAKKFMNDLTRAQGKYINIRVYDGDTSDDSALIYDSKKNRGSSPKPEFSLQKSAVVKQANWTIVWDSTPEFENQVRSYEPVLILISGGCLTVLFAAFLYSLYVRTDIVRKQVDEKTREIQYQKQQLQMIFDNVPARIWYKDSHNNMLKLNRQAAESMGGTVEMFEGHNTAEFFPDMAEKYLQDDLEAINSGAPLLGIIETYTPVGRNTEWVKTDKVPFIDSQTDRKTLLVVSQDITAQKNAEDKLRASEELNTLAVRGMSVGLWDWDIETDVLVMSYKFHEVLGESFDFDFSKSMQDFTAHIHPEERKMVEIALERHLKERKPFDVECRMGRDDGEYIWVQACGQAKWDKDGQAIRMVGSIANIDARKRAEEKLVRSNEELESFAYIASHDLQEPLRMILNFTELLKDEYWGSLDGQAREYMGYIMNGAKHMQELVRDILEYARVDKDDTEEQEVDCNKVMKQVEENLYPVISETGARILYEDLPVIKANPVQIVSLFQNLVGNGIKYRHKEAIPCVSITVVDNGHQWLFSVADNGIGIKDEFLEQIFVAFKRLHHKLEYKGTGVGLAICKKIVENLDGEIWAESEYGHGSVFNFTIPKKHK